MKRDSNGKFMSKTKYVWIMKSVNRNMGSYGGFIYPSNGMVESKDWKETPECGKGLHGFLWGEGSEGLADFTTNSRWLLIRVNPKDGFVQMESKCKFRRGEVMMVGDHHEIAKEMLKHVPSDRPYRVIGAVITRQDDLVIVGGAYSILEGGDRSTVTGGDRSTVTGGDSSTVTGGKNSAIILDYWDGNKYDRKVGKIGENGLEPNVKYKLNDKHEFVRAEFR